MNFKLVKNKQTITNDQMEIILNVEIAYSSWLSSNQELNQIPVSMWWKSVGNKRYLITKDKSTSEGRSLGPETNTNKHKYEQYIEKRTLLESRERSQKEHLSNLLFQYKSVPLPRINNDAAKILRYMDLIQVLGTKYLVVGTNAFGVYELEAREYFAKDYNSTKDFDLTWLGNNENEKSHTLLNIIKNVDNTYMMGKKRYQATNKDNYEVELLSAPSRIKTLDKNEEFKPYPILEQEWLLLGKSVRRILLDFNGAPAPLVVPDPRWMALHKLWLSKKDSRDILKKEKDLAQGKLLLNAVYNKMQTNYPLDETFLNEVRAQGNGLIEIYNAFAKEHNFKRYIKKYNF